MCQENASYPRKNTAYRKSLAAVKKLVYNDIKDKRKELTAMSIMNVKGLTKKYGSYTAVDHISFSVNRGELIGFLGVNGAGKSTTVNMLSALIPADEGSAEICGCELGRDDMELRKKIGIVYQQNCLDDMLTVKENLLCRGLLHGISRAQAKKRLEELCGILSMEDIISKRYRILSGGQKRRCEIAAALMHTPELLFLDEPTTGLDPATRRDVWETVETLRKDVGMTVFLTTHYMEEAAAANRILIIGKGKMIAEGTPFELKERYARDKIKLYCENAAKKDIAALSEMKGIDIRDEDFGISFTVNNMMDALPVINAAKGMISGFEAIQGNMDDVFLNAAGGNE